MGDHLAAVFGDLEVKFQGRDAGLDAFRERCQRRLDGEADAAAVRLQVKVVVGAWV